MSTTTTTSQLTRNQLLFAADSLFADLASNTPPLLLLYHFSTTHPVVIQHAPAACPHAKASRLTGLNAVRSYFDLLATNYTRDDIQKHAVHANVDTRQVVVTASVRWMWKASRRTWREEFTCTLGYDEYLKVISFEVATQSSPATCVMRAVDTPPPPELPAVSIHPFRRRLL